MGGLWSLRRPGAAGSARRSHGMDELDACCHSLVSLPSMPQLQCCTSSCFHLTLSSPRPTFE